MQQPIAGPDILFVAGFDPITHEVSASSVFYRDTLALPLKGMENNQDYPLIEPGELKGVNHFALWPLAQAAQSCFGKDVWPSELTAPQSWFEFEAADIALATEGLRAKVKCWW